jgi:hypothetical protein
VEVITSLATLLAVALATNRRTCWPSTRLNNRSAEKYFPHMRQTEPIILRVAELVREKIEDLVFTLSPMDFNHTTLQGACGIASRVLHRTLKRVGVQNDFVMGTYGVSLEPDKDNHCWVEVGRLNIIVDITATQFGVPFSVFVTEPAFPYLETCRDRTATKRLAKWDGQAYVWYSDRLKQIEDFVAYTCQGEQRILRAA